MKKTKKQLIDELVNLRQRMAVLEKASETRGSQFGEILSTEEDRYRKLFDRVPVGLFRSTPDGQIIDVNQTLAEMAGYPDQKSMLMKKAIDFYAKAEDRLRWGELAQDGGPIYGYEMQLLRRDGTLFWGRINVVAIRDDEGRVLHYEGSVTDITERKRMEKALRQERDKTQQFLDIAGVMLVAINTKGEIILVNKEASRILGYEVEDLKGKAWCDSFIPGEIREQVKEVFHGLMSGKSGPVKTYENPVLTRSGDQRIIAWNNTLLRDDTGTIIGSLSSGEDITERKWAEAALRESEERYRALFEGSLDALFLVDPDSGEILDANPAASELLLLPREKIVGLHHSQLHPPHLEKSSRKMFALFVRDKELRKPIETFVRRLDGHQTPVEVIGQTIQINGTPVIYMTFRNITERRRAEGKLRESEEMYRSLVRASPDAITVTDTQGYITEVSQQTIHLHGSDSADELLGKSCFDLIHPKDLEMARANLQKLLREGFVRNAEYTMLKKDGSSFTGEVNADLVRDAQGNPKSFISSVRDVTERKHLEEELAKIERLESLGVLAGGIAHDFNNLLTAILANVSMAKLYGDLRDDISEMLADAETASFRATKLTQQLLAFAKGGAPVRKTTSLARLLRETTEFALSGSNVHCEYSIPNDLWLLEIDEGQIGQVIHNLVLNADQAMPDGGRLMVGAENLIVGETDRMPLNPGNYVKISVLDNGPGIAQTHVHKIFDPFFTTKPKGSGLGLTISFTIVKNHDGYIRVDSKAGQGTRFEVYLPASEKVYATEAKGNAHPIRGNGNRILLIDDVDIIRKSASEMLKRLGYEVQVAKDGIEGIGYYREASQSGQPFDAVIMDLTVPGGMGGEYAIRELIKMDPEAKVIVSSGYSHDPVMSNFKEYGFSGVVMKPYKIEDLGQVVHNVLMGVDR